ncbi:MAG: hypothetical protein ACPGWR_22280 [Ardenticatenaceae bacterium]
MDQLINGLHGTLACGIILRRDEMLAIGMPVSVCTTQAWRSHQPTSPRLRGAPTKWEAYLGARGSAK